MTVTLFAAVVISMLSSSVYSYQFFQTQIPNGDRVPNPCDPSTIWMGVGHQNQMGGGARNPFGLDFAANDKTWNRTICQKDSDGDGLTNGQELGDPNCTWSVGQSPARTMNLTHPGICEPPQSMECASKNAWLTSCNKTKFDCPAIHDPGVKNYTMRLPLTPVPTDETTYICFLFRFPNDTDTDIIAIEPVFDNIEIIHHMSIFRCNYGEVSSHDTNAPYLCEASNAVTECNSLIGLWNFGDLGQCLNPQVGFRIGPSGYQYAILQVHWNNVEHKPNQTDSSGMRIYYTTQLRPNRGEIMFVGQSSLEIPPRHDNVTFIGNCAGLCTNAVLNQSVYITSSYLHMHLLGKSGIIRLYRNGQLLQVLQEVTNFDYNTPPLKQFDNPIEMKPGDSIQVVCSYNSTFRNTTTYWGESKTDEMCFGFFAYYPHIPDFSFCGQWKSVDICGTRAFMSDSCDMTTFLANAEYLSKFCSADCSSSNCTKALNTALMTGCQRDNDVRVYLQKYISPVFNDLAYCALAQPPASTVCTTPGSYQLPSHCSSMRSYFGLIPLLAFVVYIRRLF